MIKIKKKLILSQSNIDLKIREVINFDVDCDGKFITVSNEYFSLKVDYHRAYDQVYFGQFNGEIGAFEETILTRIVSILVKKAKVVYILNTGHQSYYSVDSPVVKNKLKSEIKKLDDALGDLLDNSILALDFVLDKVNFATNCTIFGFSSLQVFSKKVLQSSIAPSNTLLEYGQLSNQIKNHDVLSSISNQKGIGLMSTFPSASSSVHIDSNVIEFLVTNRLMFLSICDELCNMNVFSDDLSIQEILNRPLILKQRLGEIANSKEYTNSDLRNLKMRTSEMIVSFAGLYEAIYGHYPICGLNVDSVFECDRSVLGIPKILRYRDFLLLWHLSSRVEKQQGKLRFSLLSTSVNVDISKHLYMVAMSIEDIDKEVRNHIELSKSILAVLSGAMKIDGKDCTVDFISVFKFIKGIA